MDKMDKIKIIHKMIKLMFPKVLMLIRKVHQKNVLFVIIDIF